ncbi:putative coil containing protein [Vibrio phage 242E40-1]|nr:putative coil containing protein [Vibrio phage 242E40-1]
MAKKILVTKEWHEQAMFAMHEVDKHINHNESFINGLRSFLSKRLTQEQQEQLENEIESFMKEWE